MRISGFRMIAGVLGVTAAVAVAATVAARASAPPTFRGVAVAREDPEEISMWGQDCSIYCALDRVSARASSSLPASGGAKYGGALAHDMSLGTAWVEGAKGAGVGEYLEYTVDLTALKETELTLTELVVFNGYRKSRDLWQKNGRVRALTMTVNGKPRGTVLLADAYNHQRVKIAPIRLAARRKTVIRFTIASVYPGSKYEDTALTELEFDGTGHH
jgi:hypothetical protein